MGIQSKICTICKFEKSLDNFSKRKLSKDYYQNVCKECSAITSRRHYVNNLQLIKQRTKDRKERLLPIVRQFILSYLEKGCVDCGEKDILVLDFDHLENKEESISKMISNLSSLDKLENEISKCEVRCANCHRRKTAKDFNYWKYKLSIT